MLVVVGIRIELEVLRNVDFSSVGLEGSHLNSPAWTTFHLVMEVIILVGMVISGTPKAFVTWALKEQCPPRE